MGARHRGKRGIEWRHHQKRVPSGYWEEAGVPQVGHTGLQRLHAVHRRQQRLDLLCGQHHRHVLGRPGAMRLDILQFPFEHLAIEEHQGIECSISGGSAHVAVHRQMGKKGLHLG